MLHNFYKQDSESSSWIYPPIHHLPAVAPQSSDALFLQPYISFVFASSRMQIVDFFFLI